MIQKASNYEQMRKHTIVCSQVRYQFAKQKRLKAKHRLGLHKKGSEVLTCDSCFDLKRLNEERKN